MAAEGSRRLYLPPFRVDLDVLPGVRSPIAGSALARVACAALRAAGAPVPAALGLVLAGDAELARLNRVHLGHRGATDVLSFPLLPASAFPEHPGKPREPAPPGRRPAQPAFLLPPHTRVHLGDIVISVERAVAQAEAGRGGQEGNRRWEPADELRLLAAHGALHLCGWDHAAAGEARAMRTLECSILAAAGARTALEPF